MIAAAAPAGAGPTGWAHQAAGFQSNGAVTVKSLAGGSYTGTQNPTGAVAKANQNAATQAPTVIIQATSQGAQFAVTIQSFTGNLGGRSGADSKCQAEFGSGWKFASFGKMVNILPSIGIGPWLDTTNNANGSCSAWTDGTNSGVVGSYLTLQGSSAYYWSYSTTSCSGAKPLLCTTM